MYVGIKYVPLYCVEWERGAYRSICHKQAQFDDIYYVEVQNKQNSESVFD